MKLSVEAINEGLNFVKSGITANSFIQLSTTITILVKENELYFITEPEDMEVKYQTKVASVPGTPDVAVAVDGQKFIQAISTCSNNIELQILDDKVSIDNGRGALYLSLLVDDNGNKLNNTLGDVVGEAVKLSTPDPLKFVTTCLSTTMDNISIRNVYCGPGITLASDLVNIAKGAEVLPIELLVTERMRTLLLKFPECKFLNSEKNFTIVAGNCVAIFTKSFQEYLSEFPVKELEAEFTQKKEHSFTVDMEQFLNALSFLKVTTDSVNDYAVTLRAAGPDSIELESDHGSIQKLPVTWLTQETGPWEVSFDCVSALARFAFADGIRQMDVYSSQIACVGAIEVSLGLIVEED